jgi:hypothetical protein
MLDPRPNGERMTEDHLGRWSPLSLGELATLFQGADFPWWVGGGWALDLFVGHQTRAHDDLDVNVLRRDQHAARRLLDGWDLHVAAGGRLRPFRRDDWLQPNNNDLWCRTAPTAPWALQLMLTDTDGEDWLFRRNRTIHRSLAQISRRSPDSLPYLAPEIQLLFKAKDPRPKDEADFQTIQPLLDQPSRRWLATALAATHPHHRWLAQLGEPTSS